MSIKKPEEGGEEDGNLVRLPFRTHIVREAPTPPDPYAEFADDLPEELYRKALAYVSKKTDGDQELASYLLAGALNYLIVKEISGDEELEDVPDPLDEVMEEIAGAVHRLFPEPELDDEDEETEWETSPDIRPINFYGPNAWGELQGYLDGFLGNDDVPPGLGANWDLEVDE